MIYSKRLIDKAVLISINKPHTDNIFTHKKKKVEWRKKALPLATYYCYETKNKGGCGEENESLKQCMEHEHASFMEIFGQYGEKCDKLAEENEKLRGIIGEARAYKDELERILPSAFANEKADTVREMQEKLYPLYEVLCVDKGDWCYEVDQIAKEIIKETK